KKNNDKLIEFLTYLPNFYEWNDYIFVHAGVNLKINNWKDTSIRDFMWIREDFHFTPNRLNKTIVFGHTETKILNKNNKYDIWINDNKIGIDGGAVYGGYLYGVILDVHGIQDYVYV
ncbi:TPA: serine/threonine protein phosphatase, partial [Enterococcus faecium]